MNAPLNTDPQPASPTMRAIVQDRYGTDAEAVLRLSEVARPIAGEHEVLVRVAAASVDRGTWHCMTGLPYAMRLAGFGVRRPKAANPGRCFAGTITAVAGDVDAFEPGTEVYGTCDGSFAEYVRARADMIAPKPANLTFDQAAAVPISAVTALQAVRKAKVQPGQHVLVIGAAGGVGSFAVQIALSFGAEVTGVCNSAQVDFVRSLGAGHVIDYSKTDVTLGDQHYDVILDTGGSRRLSDLRRIMTSHGTLVIVGSETGGRWLGGFERSLKAVVLSPVVGQHLRMLASSENGADLQVLRELIESRHVTPPTDRTYPLDQTAAAIQHLENGGVRGKIIITM